MTVVSLLEDYGGPIARQMLLARHPELDSIIDVTGALLREQAAGGFDRAAYRKAANITDAFRRVVGAIGDEEGDTLGVDVLVALCRLRRGVRDASLIFPWPYTPEGGGTTIVLTARAEAALTRVLLYEPLRDFTTLTGSYYDGRFNNLGGMLSDALRVCAGFSLNRSNS